MLSTELKLDFITEPLEKALTEMQSLIELSEDNRIFFLNAFNSPPDPIEFLQVQSSVTPGTGENVVVLEPSCALVNAIAAVRAMQGEENAING